MFFGGVPMMVNLFLSAGRHSSEGRYIMDRSYPAPPTGRPVEAVPAVGKVSHHTGATRNDDIGYARYDLIDTYGLERLAVLYGKGALVHGERNWEKGMPTDDIANRAMRHLNQYIRGERHEDFPAKVAWAMFAIMRMEETNPSMCTLPMMNPPTKLGHGGL